MEVSLYIELALFLVTAYDVIILSFRFLKRPTRSGFGLYDPTVVMNRANLVFYNREGFIKLGYYVVSFLIYLYK